MAEDAIGGNSAKELKSVIERIEALIVERKSINEDIKEILDEAAEKNGFNKKVIRKVIARRAVARFIRQQEDSTIEAYEGIVNTDED